MKRSIGIGEWVRRALGLVVIGIHTPEFAFEKDPANVRKAVSISA